jgi:poly(3-hydroxybutyrate) depolymerase
MMKSKLLPSILLLVTLGLIASAQPVELNWKSSDHVKIGKSIGAYYEAKDERKGIHEAEGSLNKVLERIGKKFKKQDLLTFVEDWEACLREAQMLTYKSAKPKKGKIFEDVSEDFTGGTLRLVLHFPKKFSVKNGPLPLIIIAHDEGQDPRALIDEQWVSTEIRDSAILAAVQLPAKSDAWGSFSNSEASGIGTVMSAFGYMKRRFPVDMDRIYLAGTGKGIAAVLGTGAAFPHCFAAVVGRGGMPACDATNFKNLPTLFIAGGAHATEFKEQAKDELNFENCEVRATGGEAEIWAWLKEQVRDPYPTEIIFTPTTPYTRTSGWLMVEGFDEAEFPSVIAVVDRAENTISLTVEKISTVTIYFNDILLDLDQPVRVVINGVPHEQVLVRARRTMLDLGYNQGDWGRVFVATQAFGVE